MRSYAHFEEIYEEIFQIISEKVAAKKMGGVTAALSRCLFLASSLLMHHLENK